MRLVMSDLPQPVQILVAILVIVMLAGVAGWFVGIGRVMFRARAIVPPPEEAGLPIGQQSYRAMSRANEFFTSQNYRMERRLVGYGAWAIVGSMAAMFALTLIFGQKG